jgi:hypothetical protein
LPVVGGGGGGAAIYFPLVCNNTNSGT